jgi:hypothetical protein
MNTPDHPACSAAIAQAKDDCPKGQGFVARIIAEESARSLVRVLFCIPRMSPPCQVLYAVSKDCATAWGVPHTEADQHGDFFPRLK